MPTKLTEAPSTPPRTFLNFSLASNLDGLGAGLAIIGIPYGMPYMMSEMANDQSRAPDAIRQASDQRGCQRHTSSQDVRR